MQHTRTRPFKPSNSQTERAQDTLSSPSFVYHKICFVFRGRKSYVGRKIDEPDCDQSNRDCRTLRRFRWDCISSVLTSKQAIVNQTKFVPRKMYFECVSRSLGEKFNIFLWSWNSSFLNKRLSLLAYSAVQSSFSSEAINVKNCTTSPLD